MKRTLSFTLALTLALATALVAVIPVGATDTRPAGCTPGYWKQAHHFGNWVGYAPSDRFDETMARNSDGEPYVFAGAFGDKTLKQVLWQGGGGKKALGRHAVAALLNAAYFGQDADFVYNARLWRGETITDDWEVILRFNQVFPGTRREYNRLKRQFERTNQVGCPLGKALMPPRDNGEPPS